MQAQVQLTSLVTHHLLDITASDLILIVTFGGHVLFLLYRQGCRNLWPQEQNDICPSTQLVIVYLESVLHSLAIKRTMANRHEVDLNLALHLPAPLFFLPCHTGDG